MCTHYPIWHKQKSPRGRSLYESNRGTGHASMDAPKRRSSRFAPTYIPTKVRQHLQRTAEFRTTTPAKKGILLVPFFFQAQKPICQAQKQICTASIATHTNMSIAINVPPLLKAVYRRKQSIVSSARPVFTRFIGISTGDRDRAIFCDAQAILTNQGP